MNRSPRHQHSVAAAREADCFQAATFRADLHNEIDLLNEQSQVLKAALATYERRGELIQVRRIQRELRSALKTRRELIDMISALDQRFPQTASATDTRSAQG